MKQAVISFTEKMGDSHYDAREVFAAFYFDLARGCVRFLNEETAAQERNCRKELQFVYRHYSKYAKLKSLLDKFVKKELFLKNFRYFSSLEEMREWREGVYFTEDDIHWMLLIENDDGSWLLSLCLDYSFPKELEELYEYARNMDE